MILGLRADFPASARLRASSLTAGASEGGVFATNNHTIISLGRAASADARVSITATERGFVLAWAGAARASVAAVSLDGAHTRLFEIPLCVGDPSVVSYGISALAVCVTHGPGSPDALAVHRIDPIGASELVARTNCPNGGCREPVITRLGSTAVVAFIARSADAEAIYTMRLDLARKRFDAPRVFARPAPVVRGLAIASGGQRVAIAWADDRSSALALYSWSMSIRGDASGGDQRLSIRYQGGPASLAWDGAAFGIAWSEPVSGAAPRSYFALLDTNGARIGSQMRLWVPDDSAAMHPSLTFTGRGYVITYARADGTVEARSTGPRGCDAPP